MTKTRELLLPLPQQAIDDLMRFIDLAQEVSGNDPQTGMRLLLFAAACICRDKNVFLADAARIFDKASSKSA